MNAVSDLVVKLQALSEERAALVVALVENLAELEAREDAEDLAAAQEALVQYEKTGEAVTLDELEQRLGL